MKPRVRISCRPHAGELYLYRYKSAHHPQYEHISLWFITNVTARDVFYYKAIIHGYYYVKSQMYRISLIWFVAPKQSDHLKLLS